nr:hypothetical protein [Tanacetum cinerariifolium]
EPSYNQNYNDDYYSHASSSFPCCDKCGGSHETFQCQPMDQNVDFSDLKELAEYKESLENFSNEIDVSNSNQEKEEPPQDSDIRQLIREECYIEVCEEQKQNMKDTILELVEICRQKELLCMHDNIDDLIESALNSKLLSINSERLNKEKLEVKNVVEQPAERETRIEKSLHNFRVIHKSSISFNNTSQISSVHAVARILSTKELEYSPSMGYENLNTTPETESDEIIKSGVEELVPILSENEVTLEDKRECDLLVCENSPICDDHSEIFSESNNDDDISSDDNDFEDIEYVEASLFDPEIVSVEEENVVQQEEEEIDLEDISQIQDVILREKLLSINHNFSPEFKTFWDHTEKTRSGNTTTHANDSLPEYDSFCFEIEPDQERLINVLKNEISNDSSNDLLLEEADLFLAFDNSIPPVPRPPPEPPDAEFNEGEEISVVMNVIDKLECLNPKDEFDDDDYSSIMFVIYSKVFSLLLSAESEDMIFDPGIFV